MLEDVFLFLVTVACIGLLFTGAALVEWVINAVWEYRDSRKDAKRRKAQWQAIVKMVEEQEEFWNQRLKDLEK